MLRQQTDIGTVYMRLSMLRQQTDIGTSSVKEAEHA